MILLLLPFLCFFLENLEKRTRWSKCFLLAACFYSRKGNENPFTGEKQVSVNEFINYERQSINEKVKWLDWGKDTIGGVQADIAPDFVQKVKEFIAYLRPMLKEYHEVFTGNVIAQERLKGVGVLSREDAISFGATGGTGRASGWACDVRKRHPYAMYGKVDFKEIVHTEGDCFARYMVRMEEILESMDIIEQLIDNIPEGNYQEKMKPIIRVPEGNYYAAVEGSRGEFGVYLESRGDKFPYRMKFRATGLPLVSAMETMCRNAKIADLIAIGGTVDYVVPDIDR